MYFGFYGLLPFLRFVCRSAERQGYELASMPALAYMGAHRSTSNITGTCWWSSYPQGFNSPHHQMGLLLRSEGRGEETITLQTSLFVTMSVCFARAVWLSFGILSLVSRRKIMQATKQSREWYHAWQKVAFVGSGSFMPVSCWSPIRTAYEYRFQSPMHLSRVHAI